MSQIGFRSDKHSTPTPKDNSVDSPEITETRRLINETRQQLGLDFDDSPIDSAFDGGENIDERSMRHQQLLANTSLSIFAGIERELSSKLTAIIRNGPVISVEDGKALRASLYSSALQLDSLIEVFGESHPFMRGSSSPFTSLPASIPMKQPQPSAAPVQSNSEETSPPAVQSSRVEEESFDHAHAKQLNFNANFSVTILHENLYQLRDLSDQLLIRLDCHLAANKSVALSPEVFIDFAERCVTIRSLLGGTKERLLMLQGAVGNIVQ